VKKRLVSQHLEALRRRGVSTTVSRVARRSEEVRRRLREEMDRLDMSQRDVAGLVNWSQSKVAHILTGHVQMTVDDLATFCFALNLSVTEAVRDQGLEFVAEMTPTELRLLERIRQLPARDVDAVMTILDVKAKTRPHERRAGPRKLKAGR
jgi:transcriptional regulator with XRE-family HTH domain